MKILKRQRNADGMRTPAVNAHYRSGGGDHGTEQRQMLRAMKQNK